MTVFSKENTTLLLSSSVSVTSRSNRLRVAQNNWAKEVLLKTCWSNPCFMLKLCYFVVLCSGFSTQNSAMLPWVDGNFERSGNSLRLPIPCLITGPCGYRAFKNLNISPIWTLSWGFRKKLTDPSHLPSHIPLLSLLHTLFPTFPYFFRRILCNFCSSLVVAEVRNRGFFGFHEFSLCCGNTPHSF